MRQDSHQPEKVMLTRRERKQLLIMELDLLQSRSLPARLRRRLQLAPSFARSAWRRVFAPERSWKTGVLLLTIGLAITLATVATSVLAAVAGVVLAGCGLTMLSPRLQEVIARRMGSAGDHR